MTTAGLLRHQLAYEQRTIWRNPAAVFFSLGLPLVMLAIFTTLNSDDVLPDGQTFASYFVPGMLVFGLVNATYGVIASRTVLRRDGGQLKRARATPLPLRLFLAGMVLSSLVSATVAAVLVLAVGRLAFGVALPSRPGVVVLCLVLGGTSFSALGLALSTVIPNPDAADPMIYGTVLPLLFISGVFDQVPAGSALDRVAEVFPVRHLLEAALASTGHSDGQLVLHLLVVVAWGIAGSVIATHRFRWEPR